MGACIESPAFKRNAKQRINKDIIIDWTRSISDSRFLPGTSVANAHIDIQRKKLTLAYISAKNTFDAILMCMSIPHSDTNNEYVHFVKIFESQEDKPQNDM